VWTGQRWDATIGLHECEASPERSAGDYNARFYDPQLGQFTQPDSLVAGPLNPAAWNRFGYVNDNPVNLTDPTGHCALCFVAIGASLFAMGGAVYYSATHPGASFDRWDYLAAVGGAGITGAAVGYGVYLAPAAVGYGISAAGMDAIGTAVWLNRLGVSSTSLYGLMNAGQWSYNWGMALEYGGWQAIGYGITQRSGFIECGPLDNLGRRTEARALITEDMLDTGTHANPSIMPPGYQSGQPPYNRGHLIARMLGGSGDVPENLVTLHQHANTPVMRGYEDMIYRAVAGGESVFYEVTPVYSGANRIPVGITLSAEGSGGFQLHVSVLNWPK
jgi:RHS repeat-associated protein